MQGDYRYHVDKVRRAFRYGAAMRAVFDPIMAAFYKGRSWAKSGMTPENVTSANRKARTAWRRCVEGLYEQGCLDRGQADPRDIKIAVNFMRNCPPFGVYPYPKGRTCEHRFCPFCYGRRLIEGFKHIEMALYGTLHYKTPDGRQVRPLRDDLMLVGFQVLYVERYVKGEVAPPRFIRQMLPGLLAVAAEHRTAEAHAFGTVAGLVGHRVWCNMMGGIGVERSGVLLVQPPRGGHGVRQYIKKHAKYNSRFIFSAWPNKQKMASLFADVFRYPTELLRCNPEYAAMLIDGMEKKRLWAKVGSHQKAVTDFEV